MSACIFMIPHEWISKANVYELLEMRDRLERDFNNSRSHIRANGGHDRFYSDVASGRAHSLQRINIELWLRDEKLNPAFRTKEISKEQHDARMLTQQ